MGDPISGKVAAVVDDTTLVLNVGRDDGVREGMLFASVAENQEVVDPETGRSLGNWESVKARVITTHVQEKMCTVRSPLADEGAQATGTLSAMMVRHSFGLYGSTKESRQSLSVRADDMSGRSAVTPIAVGDSARLVELEQAQASEDLGERAGGSPDLPSSTYESSPEQPPAETSASEEPSSEG